jgi:hypothetical protein
MRRARARHRRLAAQMPAFVMVAKAAAVRKSGGATVTCVALGGARRPRLRRLPLERVTPVAQRVAVRLPVRRRQQRERGRGWRAASVATSAACVSCSDKLGDRLGAEYAGTRIGLRNCCFDVLHSQMTMQTTGATAACPRAPCRGTAVHRQACVRVQQRAAQANAGGAHARTHTHATQRRPHSLTYSINTHTTLS